MVSGSSISKLNRIEKAKTFSFVGSKFDGVDYLKVKDYIALGRTPYTNALGRLDDTDLKVVNETIALLQLEHLQLQILRTQPQFLRINNFWFWEIMP
jgi:ABC-type cobalamin/Fe3+-siderophores transport system ATPase subunit